MSSPAINYWIYAEISLLSKEDATTKTLKISNREVIGDLTGSYFPLLKGLSRLGVEHDRLGPTSFTGYIEVLDSIGSFGAERKISDILQRYTVHDQPISIYVASSDLETVEPTWTLAFEGLAITWFRNIASEEPTISISLQSRLFDRRIITKEVTIEQFPTAPTKNVGKFLPVVFGEEIEVPGIMVHGSSNADPIFAYATTLGEDFVNGGVQKYYVRDIDSNYKQVVSAATTTTKLFDKFTGTYVIAVTGNDEDSRTRELNVDSSTKYILTQADTKWTQGGAGQTGSLILEIWEKDIGGVFPARRVGQAIRDKADFTWGAGNVTVSFAFDKPVPLTSENGYVAYITQTTKSGTNGHPQYISGGATSVSYTIDQSQSVSTRNGWTKHVFDQVDFASTFYGVVITDSPTPSSDEVDNNGLGHSQFALTQKTFLGTINNPDLSNLDMIVSIDGLKDDSSGTVSGTNNLQITSPNHALELITREWSGSSWDASIKWDWTDPFGTDAILQSGFIARSLGGATSGKITLEEFCRNICDNSACKVILRNNGTLALYAWGKYHESVDLLTQNNCQLLKHDALDPSYVINNVKFGYARNLINFNALNQASQGIPQDYQSILNWYSGANSLTTLLVGQSEVLYGKRFLQRNNFDFINTATTAENIAVYYLTQFNEPSELVTLQASFFDYHYLGSMDVVSIQTPSLPAYFGTSPNSRSPDFDGYVTDITGGSEWTRAETYRGQIESRFIDFGPGDFPRLVMVIRLLNNTGDPT